jgi:probable HAF family extracellular repeat protein
MNKAIGLVVAFVIVGCRDATEPLPITLDPKPFRPTIVAGGSAVVIPTLGGQRSNATAINASGQVVGSSEPFFNGPQRAFLWQSGAATPPLDLGTLGGSSSFASAVNASGHVVGTSYLPGNAVTHGFLWKNGTMTDLDGAFPTGINATGQIVGWFYSTHSPPRRRAIFLPTGQLSGATDLGTLGGTDAVASGINAAGQIVGWSFTQFNAEVHGVVWQTGQPARNLGPLGGAHSEATAINTAGQVVGWSTTGVSDSYHAVLWQPGATTPQDLGTLGGTLSKATALNDAGQVVGWSMTTGNAARHMFLWTSTDGIEDLGLIGWDEVGGVNDNLQVVGGSTPGPAQFFQINFHPMNYAPVVTTLSLPDAPAATGASVDVSAGFTDANGADTHTSTIDWGDGTSSAGTVTEVGDGLGSIEAAHTYAAAGAYAVSVTVTDQRLLSGMRSSTDGDAPNYINVYVSNTAPILTSLIIPALPVAIGTSASVSASFTDGNSSDTHTSVIEWGDGTSSAGLVNSANGAGTVEGMHSYSAAGTYQVTVAVTDQGSLSGTRSSTTDATTPYLVVYVPNEPPIVTGLSLPAAPVSLGTPVSVSASFTDANPADVHTAIIDWGDGATSSGTVSAGGASGVHSYSAAGVYIVSVRVTDQGLLTGSLSSADDATATYLVVYDASAGYVAGHGSISSPAGAYAQNPTATGKASFGFVSKYARGATIPSGNTQFQFTAARFQFESTSYEWLVIAGGRAKYKGSGTINNGGNYRFLLTAVDGQLNGGSPDALRLKVWDATTGAVIYDNERGAGDDAEATTTLASGSIKIHK